MKTKKHRQKQQPRTAEPTKGPTWKEELVTNVFEHSGSKELTLSHLYDALGETAKARRNPTWKATIRRTV